MINIFKKLKFRKKRKGSATVEAALIFPLIMFIMFGIIYLSIIHYQNNVMIAESIRAMNRAGAYWQYIDMGPDGKFIKNKDGKVTPPAFDNNIPTNGIINIDMIKMRNIYRSLIDMFPEPIAFIFGVPYKIKNFNANYYVNSRIANISFKQYIDSDKEKENRNKNNLLNGQGYFIFGDDLTVDIGRSYVNPLLGLSKVFFGNGNIMEKAMEKNITVSSIISNQSEFVRNVDTIYDLSLTTYNVVKHNLSDD